MNLILCEPHEVEVGDEAIVRLTDGRAAHIRSVLRANVGDTLQLGVVDGPKGRGGILTIDDDGVTLRCDFHTAGPPPPRPAVDLLLALPRPKVLRRLWAQLAALGVGRIILTNAERVERHYFDTHILDEATYRPLLIEGLQQARDTRLPLVSIHRQFRILVEDQLDDLFPSGTRIVADSRSTGTMTSGMAGASDRRVLIAIGPEGGWNDFELRLLEAHGFRAVGLGSRTLRVDTACTALLALANASLDWSG